MDKQSKRLLSRGNNPNQVFISHLSGKKYIYEAQRVKVKMIERQNQKKKVGHWRNSAVIHSLCEEEKETTEDTEEDKAVQVYVLHCFEPQDVWVFLPCLTAAVWTVKPQLVLWLPQTSGRPLWFTALIWTWLNLSSREKQSLFLSPTMHLSSFLPLSFLSVHPFFQYWHFLLTCTCSFRDPSVMFSSFVFPSVFAAHPVMFFFCLDFLPQHLSIFFLSSFIHF